MSSYKTIRSGEIFIIDKSQRDPFGFAFYNNHTEFPLEMNLTGIAKITSRAYFSQRWFPEPKSKIALKYKKYNIYEKDEQGR
jgi:hypothetical protein